MPTAGEFDAAAARLDAVSSDLGRVTPPVRSRFGPGVLRGGTLTASIGALIETDEATVASAARQLDEQAAECRRRAQVCRDYAADVAAWERATDRWESARASHRRRVAEAREADEPPPRATYGQRPTRPGRPHSWVEI